jgi:hypothetical protein
VGKWDGRKEGWAGRWEEGGVERWEEGGWAEGWEEWERGRGIGRRRAWKG